MKRAGAAAGLLWAAPASAHSFGQVFNLPVPVWMYLWGAAAALAASFAVIAWFAGGSGTPAAPRQREIELRARWPLAALKVLSVGGLAACIATGLWGTGNPYGNFNMTFFWIVFVLGFTYFSALLGGLYDAVNPWRLLGDAIGRLWGGFARGRVRYPQRFAYWPALLLYMAFIWIELFVQTRPFSLAVVLLAYSALNLGGVWLVGARAWFRYCEFFAVFLRMVARMAPVEYVPAAESAPARLRLRAPFAGLVGESTENMSLLVFLLFMLSSTAFDGLRETQVWVSLFWLDVYPNAFKDWVGSNASEVYPRMRLLYLSWQTFWLAASPFLYLGVYLLFIRLAGVAAGSREPVRALALRFGYSLLPIALVYNITHYYTLVMVQGIKIVPLLSDPFGFGWNLFGTARWLRAPIIPEPLGVWHTQVALILLGHIVSVYLAHLEALRAFPTRRQATLSQLPMLLLMVCFTTAGLWILSLPMKGGGA